MIVIYILFIFSGVVSWTLLEYLIHRFLGHQANGKNMIRQEHLRHHAVAHYFAPFYKKIILALFVMAASTILIGLLFDWPRGFCFSVGLAGMYFIYELTHRRFHVKDPLIRYGLRMRKHHFYHHFKNPKLNHGVTTAFWDRVFGTFKKPGLVSIPRKMAMPWLYNKDHQPKTSYKRHFRIY